MQILVVSNKKIELSWVGDFNPKMIALYQSTGAQHAKTHHTYMYMIDKTIPFKGIWKMRLMNQSCHNYYSS